MVKNGTLVPPNDDASSTSPIGIAIQQVHVKKSIEITDKDGLIQPRLSEEAVEILIAASHAPDAVVRIADTFAGYEVFTGERNLVPSQTPRIRARFERALNELTGNDLLTGDDQVLRVTDMGFVLADELEAVTQQSMRPKVKVKDGMYYLTDPLPGYVEGPYCTRCFDADSKLITLIGPGWQPGIEKGFGTFRTDDGRGYTCPECVRLR